MCGIVGYIGTRSAMPILIDGITRLEYRGYDSAGVAVITDGKIDFRRSKGKIAQLEQVINENPLNGNIGLAHTRWATHGRPSEENAHPHTDCHNQLVVVHNGIIENYFSLKKELQDQGHHFKSETDTEVLAHLIEHHLDQGLEEAVRITLNKVQGSYAIGVISSREPDKIITARLASPLIIALGKEAAKEFFIASDVPAILSHTREVIFLDDKEMAVLTKEGVRITTLEGKEVDKPVTCISWDPIMAEKGGFKHFMLKEIYEQPRAIEDTMRGRLLDKEVVLDEINLSLEDLLNFNKICIIACGTAYYAGLIGKFMLEKFLRVSTEADIGSEFRYRNPIIDEKTLLIIVSQSGETADTLAGLREGKSKGAKVISICNVMGSSITRESDGIIYTRSGPEIGVASTKAFTCQLTSLYLLTIYLGTRRGTISQETALELMSDLWHIPCQVESILENSEEIKRLAHQFSHHKDFLYLGRGFNYPIALEGALKLKEISYIHAEGYAAGEMKHGPIALINEDMPIIAIATQDKVYEKVISNIIEAKARDGIIIGLATEGDEEIVSKVDHIIYIPKTTEVLSPILNVIPLQLLAYYIAEHLGCDVDQPRNLAKSVTVE